MSEIKCYGSYGALVWMGLLSGLILGIEEVVICHDLLRLLSPNDLHIAIPFRSISSALLFDIGTTTAIALSLYAYCRLGKLSRKTGTQILSTILLVMIVWVYGAGSILWQINSNSDRRVTAVSIWTFLCVAALALFYNCFRRIFRKGVGVPAHVCMSTLVYFGMLTGMRGLKSGLNSASFLKSFHFADLVILCMFLAIPCVLTFGWSSRRIRFGFISTLTVAGILIALRLASTMSAYGELEQGPVAINGAEQTSSQPNVVLVVIDTLRADRLGVYGYSKDTSPNIDALASVSDTYSHCYSTSSWTLPSHASLFTGQFPRTHGAHYTGRRGRSQPLPNDAVTLAEVLQQHGYSTGAICANEAYLSPFWNLDQGFSTYVSRWHTQSVVPTLSEVFIRYLSGVFPESRVSAWSRDLVRPSMLAYPSANVVVDIGLEWVDQVAKRPFFLFLNLMDVHDPYIPKSSFDRKINGKLSQVIDEGSLQNSLTPDEGKPMPEEFQQELAAGYDAEVAFVDFQMGRLLTGLKERGLFDQSVIILTSDHGEHLGEHGLAGHGKRLYQETVHIPLIVHLPGQIRGKVVDHKVQLVNIMPSVCEMVNATLPTTAQHGPLSSPSQVVAAELHRNFDEEPLVGLHARDILAVWQSEHKYIDNSGRVSELFDLSVDPYEKNNLISDGSAPLVSRFENLIEEFHTKVDQHQAGKNSLPALDDDTRRGLEALGYL